jgi:hypothetical protein
MNTLDTPQFSNSCGKLFADKIIFASSDKETEIDLQNVKNAAFTSRPKFQSLVFMLLPLLLFAFPIFIHDAELFLKILFFGVGLLFLIVSVIKAQKNYTLSLYLKDGTSISINVWEGNRREAQKFADMIRAKLARRQA